MAWPGGRGRRAGQGRGLGPGVAWSGVGVGGGKVAEPGAWPGAWARPGLCVEEVQGLGRGLGRRGRGPGRAAAAGWLQRRAPPPQRSPPPARSPRTRAEAPPRARRARISAAPGPALGRWDVLDRQTLEAPSSGAAVGEAAPRRRAGARVLARSPSPGAELP